MLAIAALFMTLATLAPPTASARHRDRTPPTQPTQLRVTSLGAYHVALAWRASSDSSGLVSYRVRVSDGRELSVARGVTSISIVWGLSPSTAYGFSVVAVDGSGNRSRPSDVLPVTLPADATPPSVPTLSVAYAASDALTARWTAARDDGPSVTYQLALDGTRVRSVRGTSSTIADLESDTTYALSVRALDGFGNASAWSAPVYASTLRRTTYDTLAPTTPARFWVFEDYCGDVFAMWDAALDDRDPQSSLAYEVYVDGELEARVIGTTWATLNLPQVGVTHFELVAVDSAGNASSPVVRALDVQGDCD
jgi:chitodextrinase